MKIKIVFLTSFLAILFSNDFIIKERTIADSLPKNMPVIKKILWGEKGLLRNSFVDPKSRMKELKIRRNMLQLHQRLALFTLGCMAYQYNIGNKMIDDWGNGAYVDNQQLHKNLGYVTFGSYMTAASLSIFSPPGMKYTNKKLSSNRLHRYLALIHCSGMIAQPIIGYKTANAKGKEYDEMLQLHQNVGTITLTSYFLAFITTLFK